MPQGTTLVSQNSSGSSLAPAEVIARLPVGLRPLATELRDLIGETRRSLAKVSADRIRCGQLLLELKAELGIENGGDRGGGSTRVRRFTLVTVEDIAEAFGISRRTAFSWMSDAATYTAVQQLTRAEDVEWKGKKYPATARRIEAATATLKKLEAGDLSANRAFPAIEGQIPTKDAHRAPVKHARNIARGLTALQTSLPYWAELLPKEREALEAGWEDIVGLLPATFRR